MKFISLDFESFLIDMDKSWLSPKPVCLSWCSYEGDLGNPKYFGICDNVGNHMEDAITWLFKLMFEDGYNWAWQNGYDFDLPIIWNHFPQFQEQLLRALDEGRMHDTLIRERLWDLSTSGQIKMKKGSYSLSSMVKKYLGKDISKYKQGEDIWRLRYGELDGIPWQKYPAEALEYALLDVDLHKQVMVAQKENSASSGPGSINTEALQIKAAFALRIAYQKGLKVDQSRLDVLESSLSDRIAPLQSELIARGMAHIDKKGKFVKHQKEFMMYLKRYYPDLLKYTAPTETHPDGQIRTDDSALEDLPPDEIVQLRRDLSILEKYQNTYIKNIKRDGFVFHEKYDILKETGRTSSFIQTMPKDGGIRELFTVPEGQVICTIDFAAIEACSMAQCYSDLGLSDGLLDYLNSGKTPRDYHALIGSQWYNTTKGTSLTPDEFTALRKTDEEAAKFRNLGKPAGLGLSGGIGPSTLRNTARAQGVELSEEEAVASLRFAEASIPGLVEFRGVWFSGEKGWLGEQKFIGKRKVGSYTSKAGKKLAEYNDLFGYEVNGRWRNNCTYCSLANGRSMQGPAADGAKEAIWDCFMYCWKNQLDFLFFVHDENGFGLPADTAEYHAEQLARIMCKGMQKVLPKPRITAEWSLMTHWSKKPENHIKTGKVWEEGSHVPAGGVTC